MVTGICYEHTTNGISCELTRSIELSVDRSPTSYPLNMTHLSQRELANSVITPAADIDTISVCSYTPWSRRLSYTRLIEELSRLREYLNSVIEIISNEYLMCIFMNSYSRLTKQLARSTTFLPSSYNVGYGMWRNVAQILNTLHSLLEGWLGYVLPFCRYEIMNS